MNCIMKFNHIFSSVNKSVLLSLLFIANTFTVKLFANDKIETEKNSLTSKKISQQEKLEAGEWLSGGDTSVNDQTHNAFSLPSANIDLLKRLDFSVGNSFFRNPWVSSPATTTARDGLGPIFNTNACQNCHIKDGRGHAPLPEDDHAVSLLIRLSIPAVTEAQKTMYHQNGVVPDPIYGGQLQDFALPGIKPEGKITIRYTYNSLKFADGETIELRKPHFHIGDLGYGPMHPDVMLSPRVAPPMIGLGLLEAIKEQDILLKVDEHDTDRDGISGKANRVWSVERKAFQLGRFGWKAGQPSLAQQNAAAFNGDLGITSHLFPKDHCTQLQKKCLNAPNGGEHEASPKTLQSVLFYTQSLAVPMRRNANKPEVLRGKSLFTKLDCNGCHTPSYTTGKHSEKHLSFQKIWPYTDLLLHDMGPGLADNRGEYRADGQEWRTPPLWGIGLTQTVNGHTEFLHDGRARTLMEAVLWHGGEAEASKQAVLKLNKSDQKALIAFLESL